MRRRLDDEVTLAHLASEARADANRMGPSRIAFVVPIKTVSAANSREHWAAKARRVKAERSATLLSGLRLKQWARLFKPARLIVTLTRISPRKLDEGDNLPMALKGVRDSVAELLGIDDGSDRIAWLYRQEKGKPAVLVEVEEAQLRSGRERDMDL